MSTKKKTNDLVSFTREDYNANLQEMVRIGREQGRIDTLRFILDMVEENIRTMRCELDISERSQERKLVKIVPKYEWLDKFVTELKEKEGS